MESCSTTGFAAPGAPGQERYAHAAQILCGIGPIAGADHALGSAMKVLLAMSDSSREVLAELLRDDGYSVATVGEHEAMRHLTHPCADVVIVNMRHSNMQRVTAIRAALSPETCLIVVSARSHRCADVLRAGASEFFAKPLNYTSLLHYLQSVASNPNVAFA